MGRRRTYRRSSSVIKKSSLRAGNKLLSGLFTAAILAPIAAAEYACTEAEKNGKSSKQEAISEKSTTNIGIITFLIVWIIAGVALGAFIGSFIITLFIVIFPMLCLQDIYKQHRSVQRFKIKVCDTVTLKSGGKKYKVIKIEDGKAYCVDWVTKDGGCFPIKDLMLAND